MKNRWNLLIWALLGLLIAGITGCEEEEASTPEDMMKEAAEQPAMEQPAAEQPATEVPKDHPAH